MTPARQSRAGRGLANTRNDAGQVKELPTLPRLFATTVYIRVRAVVTGLDHPVHRNRSSKTIADPASPNLDRLLDRQPFTIEEQRRNMKVPCPPLERTSTTRQNHHQNATNSAGVVRW
jgi:hypothetical protein